MYYVCVDCTTALVNHDFTGMSEETEKQVRDGMARLAAEGMHAIVDLDEFEEFAMHSICACCDSRQGGSRYGVTLEEL